MIILIFVLNRKHVKITMVTVRKMCDSTFGLLGALPSFSYDLNCKRLMTKYYLASASSMSKQVQCFLLLLSGIPGDRPSPS